MKKNWIILIILVISFLFPPESYLYGANRDKDWTNEVGENLGKVMATAITTTLKHLDQKELADQIITKLREFNNQMGGALRDPREIAAAQNFADGVGQHAGMYATELGKGFSQFSKQFILRSGAYLFVTTGAILSLFVAKHYATKYIEHRMFVPQLVKEKKSRGLIDFIRTKIGFPHQYSGPSYKDLILSQETSQELDQYFHIIRDAIHHNIELPSLLLYGPPGTGKTEIATRMAKEAGFNFAFLSGSSFSQYNEEKAIEMMTGLFTWAMKNKTIIFIDEAENLLMSRSGEISEKTQKLIAHFLSYTGTLHKNYTIIYATNLPNVLDDAINRRITHQIEIGLPGHEQRLEIARMYRISMIESQPDFLIEYDNPAEIDTLVAERTLGLSGAYIQEVFMRARNLALLNQRTINMALIQTALEQTIKKSQKKSSYIGQGANTP